MTISAGPGDLAPLARALGDALRRLGYDEAGIATRIGAPLSQTAPRAVELAQHRLGDDAFATAVRLWHLGLDLDITVAREWMAPLEPGDLAAAGLIQLHRDRVSAAVRIAPFGAALVAHDFEGGGALARNHVLGIGAATRTLAALTPRAPVTRALDVGTGAGAQALLVAAHADHVFATDLDHRAARLARLSAALSGITNIEVRAGDGYDPVAGESFDLIVANPPFVISPDQELTFRDAARGGEGMSETIVRGADAHLVEGGTAVVLANWIVRDPQAAAATPLAWTAELGCDSLVLHHDTLEPIAYAERWMLVAPSEDGEAYSAKLDRWLSYYQALGVQGIASGAIVLRKSGRQARTRVLPMPRRPDQGGDHVERLLGALDTNFGPDGEGVLGAVFSPVEPHELIQRLTYSSGEYQAREAILRLRRSAGVDGRIPADLLEMLFLLDGDRRLASIIDEVASGRDHPADDLRARAVPVVLDLFERGYLTLGSR